MPRAYRKVEILSEEVFGQKVAEETNREIAESYGLTLKQVKQLIMRQNNKAKKIAADRLSLHSDQGSQYTSQAYFDLSKSTTFNFPCPTQAAPKTTPPWKISLVPLKQNAFTIWLLPIAPKSNKPLLSMSIFTTLSAST